MKSGWLQEQVGIFISDHGQSHGHGNDAKRSSQLKNQLVELKIKVITIRL